MKELVLEVGSEVTEARPTERKVQAAPPGPAIQVLAADAAEYRQPFANALRNSRAGFALPPGSWTVRWRAGMSPGFTPAAVLQAGERVLAQSGEFSLFDLNGRKVAADRAGSAPMVLDAGKGFFYRTLPTGYFSANRMADGAPAYLFLPEFGDMFRRILIERTQKRLLVAGVERAVDPHGHVKPSRSIIEIMEIGEPVRTSGPGLLNSIRSSRQLRIASPEMLIAAGPESIVFSTPAGLFLTDWKLKVSSVLRGAFKVRNFSLDELGRIYLLAEVKKALELWLLDSEGRRIYSAPLPVEMAGANSPPVIGYDHKVYVFAGARVAAIDDKGGVAWMKETAASIGGATVTASHRLLLSDGPRVVALDGAGESEVLATLPDAVIGAPVLTSKGELLASTAKTLFCLTSK